ncbi:MAG: cytochrome b/b6 domain-containing protein [Candidatus Heimdallarchaeota archaeon]|nr:cytochrome b/b6 domain-containing protein [Candidatus Heimdallarchaeota archaeon]
MTTKNTEEGEFFIAHRYSMGHVIQHWGNLLAMMILMFTGIEIAFGDFVIGDYGSTSDFHIYVGYFLAFWSVGLYLFLVIKDKKFKEIIPTPRDFLDLFLIIGCGIGILKDCDMYPYYDYYNPEKGKYYMKYHPTQKVLAFVNLIALFGIGITGFALYNELHPDELFLATLSDNLISPIVGALAFINPIVSNWIEFKINTRIIHYFFFIYFLVSSATHGYFSLLPQNRSRLVAMIKGTEKVPIHGDTLEVTNKNKKKFNEEANTEKKEAE